MAKIKIYGDIESASVFFINSTVTPKPMGVIVAEEHPTLADRIIVKRNDRFRRDKVSFRILFRQLNINRIQNKQGEDLVASLGYDRQQVLDYINGQANLSAGTTGGDGSGTDMIGLDVCLDIMEVLQKGFDDIKYQPSILLKSMVKKNLLGKKTGQGFYKY